MSVVNVVEAVSVVDVFVRVVKVVDGSVNACACSQEHTSCS